MAVLAVSVEPRLRGMAGVSEAGVGEGHAGHRCHPQLPLAPATGIALSVTVTLNLPAHSPVILFTVAMLFHGCTQPRTFRTKRQTPETLCRQ